MNTQTPSEAFLSDLVGKPIAVHLFVVSSGTPSGRGTPPASTLFGRLESNFPDALVIEVVESGQPTGDRILIYKRAIAAIEARGTITP